MIGLFVVFTVVKAALGLLDGKDLGTPRTAELLPPPEGATVVADRSLKSQGSLDGGIRVLAVDSGESGRSAPALAERYLEQLASRGWTRAGDSGALSEDSSICLTALPMSDYLTVARRPEVVKRWLRELGRPAGTTAVLSATFC
ncbi:MAG: hypothetical protein ACRD1K_15720 [Acidimicrobiales bacterium]